MMRSSRYLVISITFVSAIAVVGLYAGSTDNYPTDSGLQTDRFAELRLRLDTPDRNQARSAVRQLGQSGDKQAVEFLKELWNHGDALNAFRHPEITDDPVVRLMIAQQLLRNGEAGNSAYGSYIKSQAQSRDWVIRANAAEALAAIGDEESIEILSAIAMTPHRLVALRAVRSLEQLSRAGSSSDLAFAALDALLGNADLEDQEVKQAIREARQKLLQSQRGVPDNRTRKGADGFVPFDEAETAPPFKNAFPELKRRAEGGDPEAQHILGERYLVGIYTEQNYTEALRWLTLAVQQGYAPAKASLAQMYLDGRGVEQDRAKAIQLLEEAAQQDYEPARRLLEVLRKGKNSQQASP